MKKIILTISSLLIGLALFSQVSSEQKPMLTADRIAMMKDSLKLSDSQVTKLWEIEHKYNPEFDTVKLDVVFDEIRAREQTRQVKIREVLTEEQRIKYDQMQASGRKGKKMMTPTSQPVKQ